MATTTDSLRGDFTCFTLYPVISNGHNSETVSGSLDNRDVLMLRESATLLRYTGRSKGLCAPDDYCIKNT
jgi:hypothetical protein